MFRTLLALVMVGCGVFCAATRDSEALAAPSAQPGKEIELDCGKGVTMKLVLIRPGTFVMGEAEDRHEVTISKPFYMGTTEVTQAQFEAVMGTNPSWTKWKKEATNPVEQVSWNEATEFCNRLSDKTRQAARLPTEAEWEYACRAGSKTRFCFGDSAEGLGDYAWYGANSSATPHPVGQKKPNAWGLYDTHGNVWEWCADCFGLYPKGAVTDPQGPAYPAATKGPSSGSFRVLRGGAWFDNPENCRSADRANWPPANRNNNTGFRLVVSVPASPAVAAPAAAQPAPAASAAAVPSELSLDPGGGGIAQEQPPRTGRPIIKKRAFLEGHTGEYVRCVAFSSDGKTLASGSDDTTVKLWEVASGKEKATLRGHTDEVWFVAFLPDGKIVVSGSLDGSVRLWDVAAGKEKASLPGFVPSEEMTWGNMALAPDGKTLAVVTKKAVTLLDLESRKERRRLQGDWGAVVFSHDGKTLALVGGKGLELRDMVSGKANLTLRGDSFGHVAFSPDDKTLAVEVDEGKDGLEDLFVKLADVATGRFRTSFRVYSEEEGIMSLGFSPDGKTLAVGRYLDGLQLWDVTTGKLKADVPPAADVADNTQFAVSLTFSPDGKILAAGGSTTTGLQHEKGIVRLWDMARQEKAFREPAGRPAPEQVQTQPASDDFKQTKEWKALNRYVGSWDNQTTVTVPEPKQGRDSQTAAWALGDRFLQIKSKSDLDNSEWMYLFGYDPNRRAGRYWWFSSLGYTAVASVSWDEATNTFTFKGEDAGPMTYIATDHFVDDDHHEWKNTLKDGDGNVVFEASGKATRRKKAAETPVPNGLAQPRNGDFKQTKEWKALNRYVGSWEDQVTVTVPERKQSHGSNTVAWTLGDRFLQANYRLEDGTEWMFLFAYDANRRAVRCWGFSSRADQAVFTGGWDEAASTFTLKAEDAGPMSVIITEHFIDDDHHEWKVITKDADGKVVYESSGKRTRQKK